MVLTGEARSDALLVLAQLAAPDLIAETQLQPRDLHLSKFEYVIYVISLRTGEARREEGREGKIEYKDALIPSSWRR